MGLVPIPAGPTASPWGSGLYPCDEYDRASANGVR